MLRTLAGFGSFAIALAALGIGDVQQIALLGRLDKVLAALRPPP